MTMPNPKGAFEMDNGTVVPMGKGISSKVKGTGLLYNELVI